MKRRVNGAGTLIKKKNGTFIGKWYFKGKAYFKAIHETSRSKALKELDKLTKAFTEENELATLYMMEAKVRATVQSKGISNAQTSLTLKDIDETFFAMKSEFDYSENTIRNIRITLKCLVKFINEHYPTIKYVHEITESIAHDFLMNKLKDKLSDNSYNAIMKRLRTVWNVLSNKGQYFTNVWKFPLKTGIESCRRALTKDEIIALIKACKTKEQQLLFMFGIYIGARLEDICSLPWSAIDFDNNLISYTPIKTKRFHKSPIVMPIHTTLLNALKTAYATKEAGEEFVLPNMQHMYKTRTIQRMLKNIFKKADIKIVNENGRVETGFHALRRTFVSRLAEKMNPFLLQKIVGHSSIDMTAYYYSINKELIKSGLSVLPDFTLPSKPVENNKPSPTPSQSENTDDIDDIINKVWGKDFDFEKRNKEIDKAKAN